ncbi:MAG: hypothetical protein GY774_30350 [Planctomycetes bacterium]|nr:hypothetical protein [Planctomycetota bacterium]
MIVKLMGSGILKVIRMSSKRLYLIILMLAIGCQQAGISVNKLSLAANATKEVSAGAKPDEQLEINKNTLLQGPSEEIRIKAATVMLGSDNPLARKILIDALVQTKNSASRMAVCKALSQSRSTEIKINNQEEFIQPLLSVFATGIAAEAQLAADATRSFEYNQIGESLESITTDGSKPVKMRINAINALKLWPDKEASIRLIRLVDDSEKLVSDEAQKALRSLGIPVGESYWARQVNISELQSKGRDEFQRDWINRQEAQMSQLRIEVESWQVLFLSSLDTIYDSKSDDADKGNFLKKYLGNSEARIKLWALDKVYKWQFASGRSKLPAELEPILLKLISDPDKDVKLKTLGLSYLSRMNSAPPLLNQLKTEPDDQVKIALLDALGGACSDALKVKPAKITPEIRKQALEFAKQFLSEEDTVKAGKGAEVLRKLLVPNGLKTEELEGYLGLLVKRYNQQKEKPDSALRGELLSSMADLCKPGSAGRDVGAKLFEPLFVEALGDKTDFVRETAMDGLIYIDKARAFKILKTNFFDDNSEILRKKLIDLAGEVGGKEDLPKLVLKIGSNSESGPAWQAMLKIFDGSDSATLNGWMDRLVSENSKTKLTEEQKIAFLKKAEAKTAAEPKMLKSVIEKLAELYYSTGQFERAAEYLDRQYKAVSTAADKAAILPKLLDASLRSSKVDLAVKLVEERLVKEDLGPGNVVIKSIDTFMNKPSGAEPDVVLQALRKVKFSGARPKWQQWLKGWASRLGKSTDGEKPKEAPKANKA